MTNEIMKASSQFTTMKESPDCRWGSEEPILKRDPRILPPSLHVEQGTTIESFDTSLLFEITEVIRVSQQSIDDIGKRYFKGLSLWVPFLCQARFERTLAQFRSAPTAEFALLLLCMSLNTYDPPQHFPPPIEHDLLYLHAKTCFAQVQVLRRPSLATIQAGILISTYEYAHGKPDDALATIDTCARMAYRANVHQKSAQLTHSEAWNTWWALRIFERTFYCETTVDDLPFITSSPDDTDPLPYQFSNNECEESPSWTTGITPLNFVEVDCLGRAAQASRLLDRVFHITKQTSHKDSIPLLMFLDGELQRLLSITMNKCHGERGGHCGAVGISIRYVLSIKAVSTLNFIRALFILHQHIGHLNNISIALDWSAHSQAALDSVTQMVIDIARSHRIIDGAEVDIISTVCCYVVRYTLHYIYEKRYADRNAWFRDTDILRQSIEKMNRRWLIEPETSSA